MPRDNERFWRTTQNLRRFEYGPRPTTNVQGVYGGGYAPIADPVFTGDPRAPTPATGDSDTSIATTAYVQAQGYATTTSVTTADNLRVLKAGDVMSGALTVGTGGGVSVTVDTPTGTDAKLRLHNGTSGDWQFSGQGAASPGELWLNNVKVGTTPVRIDASGNTIFVGTTRVQQSGGNGLTLDGSGQTQAHVYIDFKNGSTSNQEWKIGVQDFASAGQFWLYDVTHNIQRLGIDHTTGNCFNNTGSWTALSGRLLKEQIEPYERGLDAVLGLNPVRFRYAAGTPFALEDEPSEMRFGLIAEDVEPHIPEVVGRTTATIRGVDTEVRTLTVGDLTYVLVNAIKQLETRLAELERKVP